MKLSNLEHCVNHSYRSTYAQDRVFDEHFYVSNASPVSHVSNYFDLPYDETTVFPLSSSEYRSLVHNVEQFYQQLLQSVHVTIHQAVLTPDLSILLPTCCPLQLSLGNYFGSRIKIMIESVYGNNSSIIYLVIIMLWCIIRDSPLINCFHSISMAPCMSSAQQ